MQMKVFSAFMLFVLLEAGAVWAQGKLPQAAGAVKKAVSPAAKKAAVLSPGAKRMHALRESPLFNKITPTPYGDLSVFFPQLDNMQKRDLAARYYQVMEDFLAFKKELDVRLFYQTMPGESRPFSVQEKNEIFKQLGDLSFRIRALKAGPFRRDAALKSALDYLDEAAGRVDPMFQHMFGSKEWSRGNRVYNEREFLLMEPSNNFWSLSCQQGERTLFAYIRTKRIMEKLPLRRVAVLNDEKSLLALLERWYKRGGFGENTQWVFYSHSRALEYALEQGERFDLILSDVIVPGGGGLLIASQLRQNNIHIPLLALTMFEESPSTASHLYSYGMDGMIGINYTFGACAGDMLFLAKKIKNYFYYRDLHHWDY